MDSFTESTLRKLKQLSKAFVWALGITYSEFSPLLFVTESRRYYPLLYNFNIIIE